VPSYAWCSRRGAKRFVGGVAPALPMQLGFAFPSTLTRQVVFDADLGSIDRERANRGHMRGLDSLSTIVDAREELASGN
jgi:hypothetical protein